MNLNYKVFRISIHFIEVTMHSFYCLYILASVLVNIIVSYIYQDIGVNKINQYS